LSMSPSQARRNHGRGDTVKEEWIMRGVFRIGTDGFLDLRDTRRVRTPGKYEVRVSPTPEAQALNFLLSHSFPGHRRIVRRLTESDRRKIQLAIWADSVNERMDLVDRVWRSITRQVAPPVDPESPERIQIVHNGEGWAYPVYLDGNVTRVLPHGGLPVAELDSRNEELLDLKTA